MQIDELLWSEIKNELRQGWVCKSNGNKENSIVQFIAESKDHITKNH